MIFIIIILYAKKIAKNFRTFKNIAVPLGTKNSIISLNMMQILRFYIAKLVILIDILY